MFFYNFEQGQQLLLNGTLPVAKNRHQITSRTSLKCDFPQLISHSYSFVQVKIDYFLIMTVEFHQLIANLSLFVLIYYEKYVEYKLYDFMFLAVSHRGKTIP
jgi:hypothetical protein